MLTRILCGFVVVVLILFSCIPWCHGEDSVADVVKSFPESKGWRSAWIGLDDLDKVLKAAKELNFNAVISHGEGEKFRNFVAAAKSMGLESYSWFSPAVPAKPDGNFAQQMSTEENEILKNQISLAKEKKLYGSGYQGGGEPLPGRTEVLTNSIPCFHNPEVVDATKAKIKEILEANPDLTGIALDMFGYQNYHCCYCPASMKAFEVFQKSHPDIEKGKAWDQFSLESLVGFQNEICDYARSVRPDVKITVHVWPVYLPKPLYGNMLDLDYCCQTAAWFFKPFWSDEKIEEYTKTIVGDAGKYNRRQKGIPFIGYDSAKGPVGNEGKDLERLEHELRTILRNDPDGSLSIFVFKSVAGNPDAMDVFKKVFREFKIID